MSGVPLLGGARTAIANVFVNSDGNMAYQSNDGFTDTLTKNGTGDYTHTLSHHIAVANQCILITLAGEGSVNYTQVSASQIQVIIKDAIGGSAKDIGYSILIAQKQ